MKITQEQPRRVGGFLLGLAPFRRQLRFCLVLSLLFFLFTCPVNANYGLQEQYTAPGKPQQLQNIGITEKLGDFVSIKELRFSDEDGKTVLLEDYFKKGKPVALAMVYFGCPGLCTFVLNGVIESLKKLDQTYRWNSSKHFEFLIVSINPSDTPELATKKKANYLREYGHPDYGDSIHFLTGKPDQIKKLAEQVGFGYRWIEEEKQFAHGAGLMILSPLGKISRVMHGIEYPAKDLKLSFLEASNGKIGTFVDRVEMFCYKFDPNSKKYSFYAARLMQAGGVMTVVMMLIWFMILWKREPKRRGELG